MEEETGLRIALPKGRLLAETASLVERAGWGFEDYREGTRSYRLQSRTLPGFSGKIFQERDIPIQVAVGNYDLGICGLDWIEELLSKYPSSELVKLRDLGYGEGSLYAAAPLRHEVLGKKTNSSMLDIICDAEDGIRIASEYPNLAESFAMNHRLKKFSVFPLWGAAEVYPPENAEIILIPGKTGETRNPDLREIEQVLDFSAWVIVNRRSWESKDLSPVLAFLRDARMRSTAGHASVVHDGPITPARSRRAPQETGEDTVRLALADGHQQQPTVELLKKAGVQVDDYPSAAGNRRPASNLEGVVIKVIRPQDMPLQVANGNFDLAVTGRDWLTEHLDQFPGSPVVELLDLKFGWVRIVAVVSRELPVDTISELRRFYAGRERPIRVATEYVNIADKYAQDNHLGLYRVIPTWGATEAFIPEDADLLIENTQTGRTLAEHNLKIIDTLFESTAHLIANRDSLVSPKKAGKIESIIDTFRKGVE